MVCCLRTCVCQWRRWRLSSGQTEGYGWRRLGRAHDLNEANHVLRTHKLTNTILPEEHFELSDRWEMCGNDHEQRGYNPKQWWSNWNKTYILSARYNYQDSQSTNNDNFLVEDNHDYQVGYRNSCWRRRGVRLFYKPENTVSRVMLYDKTQRNGGMNSCTNKKYINRVKFHVFNSKISSLPGYYAEAYNIVLQQLWLKNEKVDTFTILCMPYSWLQLFFSKLQTRNDSSEADIFPGYFMRVDYH